MSDYNSLKNSALTNPTGNLDLGSATNRYGNIFLQGNLAIGNLVATETSLVSPKISSLTYAGDDTAADPTGSQTITVNGSGFSSGAAVYVAGSVASSVTVVSSTQVTFSSPAKSAGNYTLILVNSDGGTATFIPGIQYSGVPSWSTSSGSLASVYEYDAVSSTLAATSDSPVTYSVTSGALPTGVTLTSATGVVAGTAPSQASGSTTYNFTTSAIDGENQDTPRNFSVTVNADAVTWISPADSTSYAIFQNTAMENISLSAVSAAGKSITYTANSLPTGLSISGSNIVGTPTVVANSSSTLTATASTTNKTATKVVNWVVTAASDAYFKSVSLLLTGDTPTPTWLSDASTNNLLVTNKSDFRANAAVQPASRTPYNAATYTTAGSAWFAGEAPNGPGAYDTLSVQMPELGTVFTVEFWFYADEATPGLTSTKYFIYSNSGFNIGIYNDRGLAAGTSGFQFQTATGAFSPYTWNHVAVVRTGTGAGEFKMYLNGTLITLASGAFTSATTPITTAEAKIGGQPNGYQNLFRGNIADFRMVNGTAVYTANFTPPAAPLTAISGTVMLALQYRQGTTNSGFVDSSTNAFNVMRTQGAGTATQGTFTPFSPTGWSAYFDGTDVLATSGFGLATDYTVEFWNYLTARPSNGYYITTSSSILMAAETTKVIVGQQGGWIMNPPNDSAVYPNALPPLNQWNHFAIVRASGTTRFYLNGIQVGNSTGMNGDWTASQTWGIGGESGGGNPINVPHYMSNFRVSNVARYSGSSTTVANFTLPTADFVNDSNTTLLTLQSNRFKDNSSSPKTITQVGDTKAQAFSPYAPTDAYSAATHGGSMLFYSGDNTPYGNQYLQTSGGGINLTGTSTFTIEAWIYPTIRQAGSRGVIVSDGQGGGGTENWSFGVTTAGLLNFYWYQGGEKNCNGSTTIPLNSWNHVAISISSGAIKLFVNGVNQTLTGTTTATAPGSSLGYYTVGRAQNSTLAFLGYIMDLRVVTNTALYTANFTPPTAPLTAITNTSLLLSGTNAGVTDATSRNDLETVGYTTPEPGRRQPEIRTNVKKYGTGSIYFGGASDYLYGTANSTLAFGTGDFTVETWIYMLAIPTSGAPEIVLIGNWHLNFRGSGTFAITSDSTVFAQSPIALVTGQWYHIAAVRSSGSTKVYVDGVGGTASVCTTDFTTGAMYIGGQGSTFNNCYMDELRITKGVARYTANFTPPTAKFYLK